MKYTYFIITALLCAFGNLKAQDLILDVSKLPATIYVDEEFDSHDHGWDECDNRATRSYIQDGRYYYQTKSATVGRWQWDSYNIDPNSDYYVEVTFKVANGPEDYGTGILFNHTTTLKDNSCQFLISPNRQFIITQTIDDNSVNIKSWTWCEYIHGSGDNTIAYFVKGNHTYYYINNHLVFTGKRLQYTGSGIGFSLARGTTMSVDKFIIRYQPMTVNEVENTGQGIKTTLLGSNINSNLDQSYPVLSADGKMMFFSRTTDVGHIDIEKTTLMYSVYDDKAKEWGPAQALPSNINQSGAARVKVVYVSPDKKTILINAMYKNGQLVSNVQGLSISHKAEDGSWSDPKSIPMGGLENRSYHTSYAVANNNKAIIISMDVKGGYGERDLYVSVNQNGKWSIPQNMGATVNSFGDDFQPCLAPDNVTLYYSSVGKPGYGRADIFVTRRLDNTWLNWSEPQNLGNEINTSLSDDGLQVDANGEYAYINVNGTGTNVGKIGKVVIPEFARPKPVVIVSGKVYNKQNNEPLATSVVYENMETGNEEGTVVSSASDGSFVIVLPYGVNYGLTAKKEGFIAESKNLNLKMNDTLKHGFIEATADIYLTPLTPGVNIKLNNIFFAANKFDLIETSFSELDRLVDIMVQNPSLNIEVEGHTDKGGENATAQVLEELSQNRANAVRDYLVTKGIDAGRISTVGYGNKYPVSNTNQSLNRRVEIKIKSI